MDKERIERARGRLRVVRWLALLDAILLVCLVTSSLTGAREFVRVLGPLHGVNFLLLLVVTVLGAVDGLWRWWFPLLVLVTAGPPGALIGEIVIGRRLRTLETDQAGSTTTTEQTEIEKASILEEKQA